MHSIMIILNHFHLFLRNLRRFTTLCDDLMATVLRVDDILHAELSADIQKEINSELNRLRTGQRIKDSESAKVSPCIFLFRDNENDFLFRVKQKKIMFKMN